MSPLRHAGERSVVLLALLVAAVFVALSLVATGGRFVPQTADLYVVAQYARAMAEGHPFQYNPGEPASTGATSLLHTALLAMAWALGARGDGLIAFAVLSGASMLALATLLAVRAGRRLGGDAVGLLSGALVALGGPVAWGFLYGSDVALFMLLSLWLFERLLARFHAGPADDAVAAATLLALARPEGLVLGTGVALALAVRDRPRRGLLVLPTLAGLATFALNRWLTGHWLGSSVADKGLFASYGMVEGLSVLTQYGVDVVRGLLLGFYPSESPIGFARGWASLAFPPLGLLFVLVALARTPENLRIPVRLWAGLIALVFALGAPNLFLGVHFNRYLLWAFPSLLVLVACGLGRLDRPLFRWGATALLLVMGLQTLRFAGLYAETAGEIARRDVAAADWISAYLPRGTRVANVATSIEYLTGHRNLNLHGVTSPAFFGGRAAEREASMLESLERLPAAERPLLLLTSEAAQAASVVLRELAGEPLARFGLAGDLWLVPMRYDALQPGARPSLPESLAATSGLKLVDSLDVCDGVDERGHAYRFESRLGQLLLHGTARAASYPAEAGGERVLDAGRAIFGSERFGVRTTRKRDLVIVLRTALAPAAGIRRASGNTELQLELRPARLELRVDGRRAAASSVVPREGWDELVLRVPAAALHEGVTRLRISGRYAAFRYWFYQ